MTSIRPFIEEDIQQVADLNWKHLRGRDGSSPPLLRHYFKRLFFQNPWSDEDLPSLVAEDGKGNIVGFLGSVPRSMSYKGKAVRVAFASNFVVDPDSRWSLVGAQLLRTFVSGPQDLSMGDSGNDISREMFVSLGGTTVPLYSIHWSRILKPTQYTLYAWSWLKKNALTDSVRVGIRPFCRLLDVVAGAVPLNPLRTKNPATISAEELDMKTHLACLSESASRCPLRPEYDAHSLGWLLDFINQMRGHGELRRIVLRTKGHKIIGWYLYTLDRDGIAWVLQIGGNKHSMGSVLDHLFWDAKKKGAVAVHGRMEPKFMQDFTNRYCFFYRFGGWMTAHSRNPELVSLIHSGDAFLSRLEGEWCLAFGKYPEGQRQNVEVLSSSEEDLINA